MDMFADDPIIMTRYLDADGEPVEKVGGMWVHVETGVRAEPVALQEIRESAWVTVSEWKRWKHAD